MKKAITFAVITILAVFSMAAQDQERQRDQERIQEHILMEDGNLYQIKNQERTQLREQVQLNNGGIVNPDGTYQLRNKNQRKLKDRQCLDMDGKRYGSQNQFFEKVQARTQAMNKEHLMLQNGQVYQYKNNKQTRLQEGVTLENGTQINPDGTIQMRNKKQIRLKEGECVGMDGRRYVSRDQFRDNMERQIHRMDRADRNRVDRTMANRQGRKGRNG